MKYPIGPCGTALWPIPAVAEWLFQQDPDPLLIVIKPNRQVEPTPLAPNLRKEVHAGFWAIGEAVHHWERGVFRRLRGWCDSGHGATVDFLRSVLRIFATEMEPAGVNLGGLVSPDIGLAGRSGQFANRAGRPLYERLRNFAFGDFGSSC
jgi:hypothetical protein